MSLLWFAGCVLAIVALAFAWWVRAAAGKRIRLEGGSLYYAGSVTVEEAERAGRFLVAKGYFKAGLLDVRLYRDGTTYQLQLIVDGSEPTEKQSATSEVLAAVFSDEVLSGAACEVQYCDSALHPIAAISHRGRFGRRMSMNAAVLFYTDGVTETDAMGVATFLTVAGLFNDSSKVAQPNREGDGFDFRVAVEVDPLTAEMIDGQRQMASDLSKHVLGGRPVQVHYCKGLAATLRTDRARPAAVTSEETKLPKGQSYRAEVFYRPSEKG
jgi:hypothetical protein